MAGSYGRIATLPTGPMTSAQVAAKAAAVIVVVAVMGGTGLLTNPGHPPNKS
jgi:hypothetical protein